MVVAVGGGVTGGGGCGVGAWWWVIMGGGILHPLMNLDSLARPPWALSTLTDLTGYLATPLLLVRLTASIASTTIFAKKSMSGPMSLDDIELRQGEATPQDERRVNF